MNGTTIKRIHRGYKVADAPYKKAMKRSAKEKFPLANFVETVVLGFAAGADVSINGVSVKKWYEEMIVPSDAVSK